ncbi:MAG: hypothetical protein PHS31_07115 [Victivallaceae bacterium]|nr:hypothetical protein [Victivallaceae bacterium]
MLYGQIDLLKKLDQRHAASGDSEHEKATVEHIVEDAKRDLPNLKESEPPQPEA